VEPACIDLDAGGAAGRSSRSELDQRDLGRSDPPAAGPQTGPPALTEVSVPSLRDLAAVVLAAAVTGTACGDGDDHAATTTTVPSTTSTTTSTSRDQRVALTQSCTHQNRGVRVVVRYPERWNVNRGQDVQSCAAFDPDPIDLRPSTEFPPDLAVVVQVEPLALDRARSGRGVRVEAERMLTIDGRRALRQEVVTTGEGLEPAGVRFVRYVIDAGRDRSILASTFDVQGNDFMRSIEVLDAMAAAFEHRTLNRLARRPLTRAGWCRTPTSSSRSA